MAVTSPLCCLAGSPQTLLFTRLASLVIAVFVAIRQIGHTGTIHFKFYTVWCAVLLVVKTCCSFSEAFTDVTNHTVPC